MPLAGIGAVNIASAQEDNSSTNFDSDMLLDFSGNYCRTPCIYPDDIEPYLTTCCILWKARENVQNPSSRYSIVYNNNAFDKYLDSIVKDAQKAGEIGVKSLIPTPEGEFLDTITKGAYGEVLNINTIAQMGWYMQNISKTSSKMLEETRKGLHQETIVREKEPKIYREAREALDYKLEKTCEDAICLSKLVGGEEDQIEFFTRLKTYAETHGQGIDPLTRKHFYELDYPLIEYEEGKIYISVWDRFGNQKYRIYKDYKFFNRDDTRYHWAVGVGEVQEQFSRCGYGVPDNAQIIRIPLAEEEKENMLEIKKIAGEYSKKINELGSKRGKYWLTSEVPEIMHTATDQLKDAVRYYSSYSIEGNTLITIYPIKKVGMLDYFDSSNDFAKYMKYWEEKYLEGEAKLTYTSGEDINKAVNIINSKQYGPLTKSLVEEDYKKLARNMEELNKKYRIGIAHTDWGGILESDIKIKKDQSSMRYKILHFIEALGALGKKEEKENLFEEESMQKVLDLAYQKYRDGQKLYVNFKGYESGIPYYLVRRTVEPKGTIYFNNNKKEIIKFPTAQGSYPSRHIGQNTIEIITEDTGPSYDFRICKTKIYVDNDDILRPYS